MEGDDTVGDDYYFRYETDAELLVFRQPDKDEESFIAERQKKNSKSMLILMTVVSVLMLFLLVVMRVHIISYCALIFPALIILFILRSSGYRDYGVLYGEVISKKTVFWGKNRYYYLSVWFGKEKKYCHKISFSGTKTQYDSLSPGSRVMVCRIHKTISALIIPDNLKDHS